MSAQNDPAVDVRDVSIAYGKTPVVRNVSFDVRPGEVCALLGESGSGKTTMLRAIAGLLPVASGAIRIGGRVVDQPAARTWLPPEKRSAGVVFQDYALFPNMSVAKNVAYGAAKRGVAGELLSRVGLEGYDQRKVTELSGGEQQRVAVARVLAQEPRVVLLDEPFSNLNRSLRRRLRDDTIDVIRDTGAAAILVTHDPEEALGSADRVAVLLNGQLLQHGTPEEVYRTPVDRAVAEATGDAFFVPVDASSGDTARSILGPLVTQGSGVHAVVRPEQLTLGKGDEGVAATVVRCEFIGPVVYLHVEVSGSRFRVPAVEPVSPGSSVHVRVRGICCCVDT